MNRNIYRFFMGLIISFVFILSGCKKDSNPVSNDSQPDSVSYAGKIYHTLRIGNQTWLKENLNVGSMISGWQNQVNNRTIEKYCYNNDSLNCIKYGGLYQWDEAMAYITTAGAQGICPAGWHIPRIEELRELDLAVNNEGNALKQIGEGAGVGAGTNTSGFSALLTGYRYFDGNFYDQSKCTFLWTSSEMSATTIRYLYLRNDNNTNYFSFEFKAYGFSIRCIKD